MLIRLLIAHFLSDFIFQFKAIIEDKKWFSKGMLAHIGIVYVSTALLSGWWLVAIPIALIHYAVDGSKIQLNKIYSHKIFMLFVGDQLLHFITLLLVWAYKYDLFVPISSCLCAPITSYKWSVLLLAYLLVTNPMAYLIKFALQKIPSTHPTLLSTQEENKEQSQSHEKGGHLIGVYERIIILTFVLFHQYEAIGFLITGKSIIRFATKDEDIRSEYVLIGTMMSFALSLLLGIGVNYLLEYSH